MSTSVTDIRLLTSEHRASERTEASPPEGILDATIGFTDAALMCALWILVFASSIVSVGIAGPAMFLSLAVILTLRNPCNGLLILLLIFYTPAVTVGIPNIFTVVAALTLASTILLTPASIGRLLIKPGPVLLAALVFVLYGAVQTILSDNMTLALPYYKKYLEGIGLLTILFLTVQSRNDLGRVLIWWAVVAGLTTIVKAAHIYFGDNTVLYRTMEAMFLNDEFGLEHRIHIRHGGETGRRFLLPGEEPNYTSASLVFPLALALAFYSAGKAIAKLFWAGIACMTAIACVGTYSRSGFLATALVGGLYVLRGNAVKAIIPVGSMAAAFAVAVVSIPSLHKRIFGIGGAVNEGATGRFDLWRQAIDMWFDSPIFGNGMSAFYDRYHGAAHNTYLQVLAETGVVGFALYGTVIAVAIRVGRRLQKSEAFSKAVADIQLSKSALSGLFAFCFMIATVTYQDVKLFWLALGVYAAIYLIQRSPRPLNSREC